MLGPFRLPIKGHQMIFWCQNKLWKTVSDVPKILKNKMVSDSPLRQSNAST